MFPYKQIQCLNKDEYILLKALFKDHKTFLSASEQTALLEIHNRVFNTNKAPSTCGSCVKDLYNTMQRLFNEYEQETQA